MEITDDQVHKEMSHHQAETIDEARRKASRALIIRHLLIDAAIERKMINPDAVNALAKEQEEMIIEQLLEDVIQLPEADEATCERYYNRNLQRFEDHTTGDVLPFHMVKEHIRTFLEDKGYQSAFSAYMDSLMDKANIVGI